MNRANTTHEERSGQERGSALIVVMVALSLITALVLWSLPTSTQPQAARGTELLRLNTDAESGIAAKIEAIAASASDPTVVVADLDLRNGDHAIEVRVEPLEQNLYRVTSTATNPQGRSVEVSVTMTSSVRPAAPGGAVSLVSRTVTAGR